MSAYIVAQIQIRDRAGYSRYEAGFMEIFSRYGGELVAIDEDTTTLEGEWPYTRTVILRFADNEKAEAWFNSDDYQTLAEHRRAASDGNIVLVKALS